MEEELKIGEQEREALRIETQRLRDELSDLRIESDIVQEKLRLAEATIEKYHERKVSSQLAGESLRPRSPASEASTSATTLSSPTAASTPPHTNKDALRPDVTPPSPPLSDAPISTRPAPTTPMPTMRKSSARDPAATPRPPLHQPRLPRHSRGPSIPAPRQSIGANGRATPSIKTTAPAPRVPRPSIGGNAPAGGLPRSGSLYQIRGLIGKMQKLEERVYSARSKLPAPTNTPPRASPRNGSALGHHIPANVTLRSSRKRTSQASVASSRTGAPDSGVSRLSFGIPTSSREPGSSRPSSRASISSQSRPESRSGLQRPESRSGIQRPESRSGIQRPESRSGTRTPMGHYSSASISGRIQRPRSSMSGISSAHSHTQSFSMSLRDSETGSNSDGSNVATPIARRLTLDKSGIPTPSGIPRRQSGGRRTSSGMGDGFGGDMAPPARPRKMSTQNEEETY